MIALALALALFVLVAAACELLDWLLGHGGGGTSYVTEEEIRRVEEQIR